MCRIFGLCVLVTVLCCCLENQADEKRLDPYLRNSDSLAKSPAEMKQYTQKIRDSDVSFEMLPIPGGEFTMGSPLEEEHRKVDEGPQHRVKIEPFWMGKYEVTWNEYEIWIYGLDSRLRKKTEIKPTAIDKKADAVSRPSIPAMDFSFGMGRGRRPVVSMTHYAAKMYCAWLSEKTGQYYRLPTEAEWEYACRAGTLTSFSFGDDVKQLGDYAVFYGNSEEGYRRVGQKKPNPWGLYDMHGNVAEWCLDQYLPDFYKRSKSQPTTLTPYAIPTKIFPRVARGGSWFDDPQDLRSANRIYSEFDWLLQDPNASQSMWYLTNGDFVGFRLVRPFKRPSEKEITEKVYYPDIPEHLRKDR